MPVGHVGRFRRSFGEMMLNDSGGRQSGFRVDKSPSSLLRGRRERRWLLSAAVAVMLLASMTGCDGGPAFGTRLEVVNECGVDLAVAFQESPSPAPDWDTSQEVDRLSSGQARRWLAAPLKPSEATIEYVWVALPGSSTWGSPTEVDIGDLPDAGGSEGSGARVLRITDDLCPG